jgi:hypothetical protein
MWKYFIETNLNRCKYIINNNNMKIIDVILKNNGKNEIPNDNINITFNNRYNIIYIHRYRNRW